MKTAKKFRKSAGLGLLPLLIAALLSNSASGAAPSTGTELEFAGDTARYSAGQVAVPVECVGEPTSFCSGALSLSSHGRKSVSSFSVRGGGSDTVFVPLPPGSNGPGAKIGAVATTTQSLGPAIKRTAILHLR